VEQLSLVFERADTPPGLAESGSFAGEWGIPKDTAAGRRMFAERMESRRRDDDRDEFKPVERGWCLGTEAFREELLKQVNTPAGPSHFGEALHEAVEVRAERIVVEGLKRLRWREADLRARRKGEPGKVKLARELRSATTMPLAWIADRLSMGSRGYLAWLLGKRRKTKDKQPEQQPMLSI